MFQKLSKKINKLKQTTKNVAIDKNNFPNTAIHVNLLMKALHKELMPQILGRRKALSFLHAKKPS